MDNIFIPLSTRAFNFGVKTFLPSSIAEHVLMINEMRLVYPILGDGLVFDIGANVGIYTRRFLKHGNKVVSIEPGIEAYREMEDKFKDNPMWKGYNAAVTDHIGTVNFNRALGNKSAASSIHNEAIKLADRVDYKSEWVRESVRAITLRKLIKDNGLPEYCKIDTEGHEPTVLSTLDEPITSFGIEVWEHIPGWERTFDILASLGNYKFKYDYAGQHKYFNNQKWLSFEQIRKHLNAIPDDHTTSYRTVDVFATLL